MHPLDGSRAKIERAWNQLITLEKVTNQFFKDNSCTAVLAETDRKTGGRSVRINNCPTILPDEWGVIIGEIAHDLRSALDLLAWQLRRVKDDFDFITQFPICERAKTTKQSEQRTSFRFKIPKKGWIINKDITNIDEKYLKKLESFQPYKRGNKGKRNPLYLLQQINNTDKHRLITVLTPAIGRFTFHGHIGGGSTFKKKMRLYPNAKIGIVMPLPEGGIDVIDLTDGKITAREEVEVNFDIELGIRFGDSCNAVKRLPVLRTLSLIHRQVYNIIESFTDDI